MARPKSWALPRILGIFSALLSLNFLFFPVNSLACSVFSVEVYKGDDITNVIGSRTLDFEFGVPTPMAKGLAGVNNVSHVNVGNIPFDKTVSWENKYTYIGKLLTLSGEIGDGINEKGLYMGSLYLPGKTKYPLYSPENPAKALAVFDLVNYVLGTSSSVPEALENLKDVQIIENALSLGQSFIVPELHYFMKDKYGNGAIIEFVDGKTVIYTNESDNEIINVMTNSPAYDWQMNNYREVSADFVDHNTDFQVDGVYANGSGYLGLPGDDTPESRFVKLKTVLKAMPKATNENDALYLNQQALSTAIIPIGLNPAPTLWYSTFNLNSGDYFITHLINIGIKNQYVLANMNNNVSKYNVKGSLKGILIESKIKYPKHFADPQLVTRPKPPEPNTPYDGKFRNIQP